MKISNFIEIVHILQYGMYPRRNIEIGSPKIIHIMK